MWVRFKMVSSVQITVYFPSIPLLYSQHIRCNTGNKEMTALPVNFDTGRSQVQDVGV